MRTLQILTLALLATAVRADTIEVVYFLDFTTNDGVMVDLALNEFDFLSLDFEAEKQILGAPEQVSSFWLWPLDENGNRFSWDPGLYIAEPPVNQPPISLPGSAAEVPEPSSLVLFATILAVAYLMTWIGLAPEKSSRNTNSPQK